VTADALITDQPFGTGWIRGGGKKVGEFKHRKETADWDVFSLAWMDYAPATVAAFCPIPGIWEMCLRLKTPCVLKYRKTNPAPFGVACEPIVCSRPPDLSWECEAYNGSNTEHPCQKPLEVMDWLIFSFTKVDDVVLDPFMGSGSTGCSALKLERKFIGIEAEVQYFDVACRRIENAQRQERLFA
jgi:hypothetical protein